MNLQPEKACVIDSKAYAHKNESIYFCQGKKTQKLKL